MIGGDLVNSQHAVSFVDFGADGFAGKQRVRAGVRALHGDSHRGRRNHWFTAKRHRVIQMVAIPHGDRDFSIRTFQSQLGSKDLLRNRAR